MDEKTELTLAYLIRNTRVVALGTLHEGAPNLAMVAVAMENDFSAFYILVSNLGKHTGDMEKNPHVSLLFTEADDQRPDPQTLMRFSLNGMADLLPRTDSRYQRIRHTYLARFPEAEKLFSLGDFNLWLISPKGGRFVAGFGQAFHITSESLRKVSNL